MTEKIKTAEIVENTAKKVPIFTKDQLRNSDKYAKYRDVVGVVLEEDKTYTVEECEKLINSFLNRKCERKVK